MMVAASEAKREMDDIRSLLRGLFEDDGFVALARSVGLADVPLAVATWIDSDEAHRSIGPDRARLRLSRWAERNLRHMAPACRQETEEALALFGNRSERLTHALAVLSNRGGARRRATRSNPKRVAARRSVEQQVSALFMMSRSGTHDGYAQNMVNVTIARAYVVQLISNDRMARWLSKQRSRALKGLERIVGAKQGERSRRSVG